MSRRSEYNSGRIDKEQVRVERLNRSINVGWRSPDHPTNDVGHATGIHECGHIPCTDGELIEAMKQVWPASRSRSAGDVRGIARGAQGGPKTARSGGGRDDVRSLPVGDRPRMSQKHQEGE